MQFNINFMTFSLPLLYCPPKNLKDISEDKFKRFIRDEGVMANFCMTTKYLIKLRKVIGTKVKCVFTWWKRSPMILRKR